MANAATSAKPATSARPAASARPGSSAPAQTPAQAPAQTGFGPFRRFRIRTALVFLLGVVAGIIIGQSWASHDMTQARETIQALQADNSKLQAKVVEQTGALSARQADIDKLNAKLHAIQPAADTYTLDPNQSLRLAGGRLLVALVGAPANAGITINVNGKQHFAAAGDLIKDPKDPPCQVQVQSFDMFQALITASCQQPNKSP
jgi:hypothetical protein